MLDALGQRWLWDWGFSAEEPPGALGVSLNNESSQGMAQQNPTLQALRRI